MLARPVLAIVGRLSGEQTTHISALRDDDMVSEGDIRHEFSCFEIDEACRVDMLWIPSGLAGGYVATSEAASFFGPAAGHPCQEARHRPTSR